MMRTKITNYLGNDDVMIFFIKWPVIYGLVQIIMNRTNFT